MNQLMSLSQIFGRPATQTEATQVTRWVMKRVITPAVRGEGSGSRHLFTPSQARLLRLLLAINHELAMGSNGPPPDVIAAIWSGYGDWPIAMPYPANIILERYRHGETSRLDFWRAVPSHHDIFGSGRISLVIPIQENPPC